MTLFQQPGRLVDLSIDALCNYVSTLVQDCNRNSFNMEGSIKYLHILKDTIPQSLANKIIESLVWKLDEKLPALCRAINVNRSELLDIIILPTVTRLDFCLDSLHEAPPMTFYRDWNGYIFSEVLRRVNALHELKVLRVFHKFDRKYLFPSSLIEFTHQNCDIEVLKQVSECCKGLRKLDLCNSSSIGDSSIIFILKFRFLEHLDLFGTSINGSEMTKLLQKLAENKCDGDACQLKSFGCNNLTTRLFGTLLHNYPQLTSLKFKRNIRCEFDLLVNLKYLKSFSIMYVSSKDLAKILDTVGSQLIVLHFGCTEGFDLLKLAVKCVAVECLHIKSLARDIIVPKVKDTKKLPGLKSVKCLYAHFRNSPDAVACLVSACKDVEVLEVKSDSDGELIKDAILENSMAALRELNWRCPGYVKDFTLRVVQHCPSVEVVRGIGHFSWKGHCRNAFKARHRFILGHYIENIFAGFEAIAAFDYYDESD